jgi:hypothetical protein
MNLVPLHIGGFGFIAIATAESHYARFHALYHREFGHGSSLAAAANARGGSGFGGVGSGGGLFRGAPSDTLTTAGGLSLAYTPRFKAHLICFYPFTTTDILCEHGEPLHVRYFP